MNCRERFLAACFREPVDRPPVWMMRQAGRYLPEYCRVRSRQSFLQLCKTPELAAEVTLQPVRRFGMDAAILFSDILLIPEAMGISVIYVEGGPKLQPTITSEDALRCLKTPQAGKDLAFTTDILSLVREQLGSDKALIGFAGAPYTLATYMIEGGGNRNLLSTKQMQYNSPKLFCKLLAKLSDAIANFLHLQVQAGVDAVQLFDTWAGNLSPSDYETFALPYTRRVIESLQSANVPIILYINGISGLLELAASSGAHVLGVDWRLNLEIAHARTGGEVALQGNMDPTLLFASPARIRTEVNRIHHALSVKTGHIFNLGHGILPSTPLSGASAFIKSVKELS